MLTDQEQENLVLQLCATAEVMGGALKPGVALLVAEDLSGHNFRTIVRALSRVRMECYGMLTLKHILDRMDDGTQHPGGSEAWGRCLAAEDEANTVVWTSEMEQAWHVALPVLEGRDRVGARMAFIQHYERLTSRAVAVGSKPGWRISQGFDPALRHREIQRALETGLLPAPLAEKYLPLSASGNNISGQKRIAAKVHEMAEAMAADRRKREKARRKRIEKERSTRLNLFDEQYQQLLDKQEKLDIKRR